jgi:hypothetical protein
MGLVFVKCQETLLNVFVEEVPIHAACVVRLRWGAPSCFVEVTPGDVRLDQLIARFASQ